VYRVIEALFAAEMRGDLNAEVENCAVMRGGYQRKRGKKIPSSIFFISRIVCDIY